MQAREFHLTPDMTYGDMRRYAAGLDVTICSNKLPKGVLGVYSEALKTIILDRGISYTQKRCTLTHELIHWSFYDESCEHLTRTKAELRTRRLTAQLLVSEWRAENFGMEYEGDPSYIANELNVTVQVLTDFNDLVLPRQMDSYGLTSNIEAAMTAQTWPW